MDADFQRMELWRRELMIDIETAGLLQPRNDQSQSQDRAMSEASSTTLRDMSQSRESTVTIIAHSDKPYPPLDSLDAMDIDVPETTGPSKSTREPPTLIVGTDFGTTFSSIAFALCDGVTPPSVKMIANYPQDPMTMQGRPSLEVPTESWYPTAEQMAELSLEMDTNFPEDERSGDLYGVSEGEEENDLHLDDNSSGENGVKPAKSFPSAANNRFFHWGYETQNLVALDMDPKKYDRIARSKLLLDTSNHTERVRTDLKPITERLQDRRIIGQDLDVISHYLTRLFEHAKKQLFELHGISTSIRIEHVLCVPIVWKSQALRRMQVAMETAVKRSNFGTTDNLFLVSEPEPLRHTWLIGERKSTWVPV
jgi:hypothetical protein